MYFSIFFSVKLVFIYSNVSLLHSCKDIYLSCAKADMDATNSDQMRIKFFISLLFTVIRYNFIINRLGIV